MWYIAAVLDKPEKPANTVIIFLGLDEIYQYGSYLLFEKNR